MTKIEQWQEWAKQRKESFENYNGLQKELRRTTLDFYTSVTDTMKNGCVRYDTIRDMIVIYTHYDRIDLSVYAGKELLSALKQLYEP